MIQQEKEWWLACVGDAFQRAGQPLETTVLRRLTGQLFYHYASPDAWVVPEDVPRCLQRWHGAGLKLAVVSNFDRRLGFPAGEVVAAPLVHGRGDLKPRCGVAKPDPPVVSPGPGAAGAVTR